MVGTPCYLAPEQAASEPVDERADVYSLGAILYHLLAGHPPYWDSVERSADRLIAAALQQVPTPIGRIAPRAPADLRAIAERAMARDKAARFPTAKDMADELRRFETGQLLRSREYRLRELLVRWIVSGKTGRLEILDVSARRPGPPRTVPEVMRRVGDSPRWRVVNGRVVERP